MVDPNFVEIGHPEIIDKRAKRSIDVDPGGVLSDYVPFYFTPCSPMLYNIVTGWKGLTRRSRAEIAVIVSSLNRLERAGCQYVISDRNATLAHATIRAGRELLQDLSWSNWQNRDFKHDPDKPQKIEQYQAEALVYKVLPAEAIGAIITYDDASKASVQTAVTNAGINIPVHARGAWYP